MVSLVRGGGQAHDQGDARGAEGDAVRARANFLVTEIDYIRPFKLKAMSMPWTEDYAWQIAEFSPRDAEVTIDTSIVPLAR